MIRIPTVGSGADLYMCVDRQGLSLLKRQTTDDGVRFGEVLCLLRQELHKTISSSIGDSLTGKIHRAKC